MHITEFDNTTLIATGFIFNLHININTKIIIYPIYEINSLYGKDIIVTIFLINVKSKNNIVFWYEFVVYI